MSKHTYIGKVCIGNSTCMDVKVIRSQSIEPGYGPEARWLNIRGGALGNWSIDVDGKRFDNPDVVSIALSGESERMTWIEALRFMADELERMED